MNDLPRQRTSLGLLAALFAGLALLLAAGGRAYWHREERDLRGRRYGELQTIASLKAAQIVAWRKDRLTDVRLATSRKELSERIVRWVDRPGDETLREDILQDMNLFREIRDYQNVILTAPDGRLLLTLDPKTKGKDQEIATLSLQAIREGQPVLGDLFRCSECGQVHLDAAAPILDGHGNPRAVVILRTDPERVLYPLLQSWPAFGETGETLLVRREGSEVLFLNRLRHRDDAPLTLRAPLARADLPSAAALNGRSGEFDGHDYRNEEVLADLRAIPGSPWALVAKVDAREILAEARYRGWTILALTGLGIVLLGSVLGFIFYLGQAKLYQDLFRATRIDGAGAFEAGAAWTRRCSRLAGAAGLFSLFIGSLAMVGWALDLPVLKSVLPGFVAMKVNTALGLMLAGGAIALQAWSRNRRLLHRGLALALTLLGAATLAQYLFRVDLHIDQWLFREPAGAIGTLAPGRMAPATALAFTLAGTALLLAGFRRTSLASQWLALPVGLIGVLPLLGYLYGRFGTSGLGHYLQLALHTSIGLMAVSLGLVLLNPSAGFTRVATADSMGGWLMRRLLPIILGVSILLGWLRAMGEQWGWFEHSLAIALLVTSFTLLFTGATWWAARSLDHMDDIRSQAEARAREAAEEIRATLYGIGDGVIATDAAGAVLHMNPAAEQLTGWEESQAVGRPLAEVFRIVNEESRQPVESPVTRVLREGRVVGLANHTLLIARDGTERAIADSGAPILNDRRDIARVVLVFRDQTEERRHQQELQASEAKFRQLHESLWDAYARVDARGYIIEANAIYQAMVGYSGEELRSMTYLDLTPSGWHAAEARIIQEQVAIRGYSEVYEKAYRKKDGTVFPVELRTVQFRDEQGRPAGMWAIVRDITERKLDEARLQAAERMARGTLDALSKHIAILDEHGSILEVNQAWRRFAEENPPIVGRVNEGANYFEVCAAVTGPDAESAAAFVAGIRSVMEGGCKEYLQEYDCHSPDTQRWFLARVTRFAGEGPIRIVVAHQDITERKRAVMGMLRALTEAARFRGAMDQLAACVYIKDRQHRYVYGNRPTLELLGCTAEELVGSPDSRFFPPETVARLHEVDSRVLEQGDDTAEETLSITPEGRRRVFWEVKTPIFEDSGRIWGLCGISTDITKHKEAEEALRASEEKFRVLVESNPDAIFVHTAGRFAYVNEAAIRMVGAREAGDLLGQAVLDRVPVERRELVSGRIRRLQQERTAVARDEETFLRLDGSLVQAEVTAAHIDYGGQESVLTFVQDITERKEAEEALRASEEKFRLLVERNPDAIFVHTAGRFAYVNEAGIRLVGAREAGDLLGQAVLDRVPMELREGLRERLRQRTTVERNEETFLRLDGSSFQAEVTVAIIHYQGQESFLTFVRDITERKEAEEALRASEEKFRLLVERNPDAIFVHTAGRFTYVNEAGIRLAGARDAGELLGQPVLDRVPMEWREIVRERLQQRTTVERMEETILRLDGSSFQAEVTTAIIHYHGQESFLTFVRDTTARKEAEAQIRAAQAETQRLLDIADRSRRALLSMIEDLKISEEQIRHLNQDLEHRVESRTTQLAEANKELEAFAYSVSHDLRAPLRHMDGFLSMLEQHLGDRLDDKGGHYLRVAKRAAVRMAQLVDGLLSFSRLGRTELRRVMVDLPYLVASVIEEFKVECADRLVHWEVAELPAVLGDPTLLRLVFQNLVGNALKFTRNRPEARIEIRAVEAPAGECVIAIRDNGVGFDAAYTHKLFGVFQRLHREDEFEGTGIGLANAHRIISRHGGRVWAEGRLDAGATFFIALPTEGRES